MSVDEAISGHTTTERKGSTMSALHKVKTTIAPDEETVLASDAEYHDLKSWGLIKEYVSGPAAEKSTDTGKKG